MKKVTIRNMRLLALCAGLAAVCAAAVAAGQPPKAGEQVSFFSDDGVRISGTYYPPAYRKNMVVILLHGLGSTQGEWTGFATKLVEKGYGVLTYDLRGHGQSVTTRSGNKIAYKDFDLPGTDMTWSRTIDDLAAAVRFLNRDKRIRERRVGLVGASLGANICFLYAAAHDNAPFAILLSPGINYAGLSSLNAIEGYGDRPLLVVAAHGDTYAYRSSGVLYGRMQGKRMEFLDGGEGHGVQMFDGKLEGRLIDWIAAHAAAPEGE